MALGGRLVRHLPSVLCRTSLISQTIRQNCVRLCVPSRLSSHAITLNQKSLIKPHNVLEGKESEQSTVDEEKITSKIISNVNQQIENRSHGRLFAVLHLCGKQFKVTTEDLVVVDGYWAPNVGDKLKLKKILLVGGSDFTLIGRPILPHGLASVEATVIEKTMSHTKTIFHKRRRKQFMRINFHRSEYTLLRINAIEISENVNIKKDVEGLEDTIF